MCGNFFSLSFQSVLMGIFVGLVASRLLRDVNMDYNSVQQTTLMMLFAYLGYLCAEAAALSGIISMFTTGLVLAHYAYWNINARAKVGTEIAVTSIANICQSFLYIYLGLSAFSIEAEYVKPDMIYVTMGAILICRVFSVGVPIFLCWLCSGCQPLKLKWNEWVFVYFGGLIRGAVCFGLSLTMTSDNRRILRTTTQICALALIVCIGSPLQLIAYIFGIKPDREKGKEAAEEGKALAETAEDGKKAGEAVAERESFSQDSQFSRAGAKDEAEVTEMIDQSFYELIKEDTFPWLLQKWLHFDLNYMMPMFKRKTALSGTGQGHGSSRHNRSDLK